MNEDNKPKLHLRRHKNIAGSSSSGPDVDAFLAGLHSADNSHAPMPHGLDLRRSHDSSAVRQSKSYVRSNIEGFKESTDITDVWGDLKSRQIDAGQDGSITNREIGEVIDRVGAVMGGASRRFKSAYSSAAKDSRGKKATIGVQSKYTRVAQGASPLKAIGGSSLQGRLKSARVGSETSANSSAYDGATSPFDMGAVIERARSLLVSTLKRRRVFVVVAAVAAAGFMLTLGAVGSGSTPQDHGNEAQVNGVSTDTRVGSGASGASESVTGVAVIDRETHFDLMFPLSLNKKETGVAVVSPPEVPPVYAYNDELSGATLSISQQEIPESFKPNVDVSLEDLANSFAATDAFKAGKVVVYHGYTDKNGGVQSLMYIKNNLLVLISSTEKLIDEEWISYIKTLN